MIHRSAKNNLDSWFNQPKRKPLVIRGARQVGKSTLVRLFASAHPLTLCEANLERYLELETVFKTNNPKLILRELENLPSISRKIDAKNSLLFLDEIQAAPSALPALRYLQEDYPDLAIVAAGSLLEFILSDHSFSMPVGRIQYLQLGPLTFEEFLDAMGEMQLLNELLHYQPREPFPRMAHARLTERQREFLFLGGMPEAVAAFQEKRPLTEIQEIHDSILNTYQDDFIKYKKNLEPLQLKLIFQKIPAHIGKKVKYTYFSREHKAREIRKILQLFFQARIVSPVFHSQCQGIPLAAGAQMETYKLLFLDIGLMNRFLGVNWAQMIQKNTVELVNEGALAEQFIGQHLLFLEGNPSMSCLYYWLREGKTGNAEVDYVMSCGDRDIFPIEVKAGTTGQLKSLHQFVFAKHSRFAVRFNLDLPVLEPIETNLITEKTHTVRFSLLSLPLYLVGQLVRLAQAI